jgi:tryptophan-rich sensory protein
MICFAFYMSISCQYRFRKKLIKLYVAQLILNISWNPIFFNLHYVLLGLITILSLTFIIGFILFSYWRELKLNSVLIIPYLICLIIASSLNGYIFFNN